MTVHQFRHAAAAIFLKEHPGQYEAVRQMLGHRNIQTTINFYVGLEMMQASEIFGGIIKSGWTVIWSQPNERLSEEQWQKERRTLYVHEWPEADRLAWQDACQADLPSQERRFSKPPCHSKSGRVCEAVWPVSGFSEAHWSLSIWTRRRPPT